MELPSAFMERMKKMLGTEYGEFLESFETERTQGLRLNLLKTEKETFLRQSPFSLKPVPWAGEGYYYDASDRPGRHPYHEAGVYYIQEPSAMAVVSFLEPKPGECILDLCAAPGGKTTQIASQMRGKGLLISNEIHPARAKILSQNVERMGIPNALVCNEDAGHLAAAFPEFFDRIAVDAPCSGEGMFRKDEEARSQWSPENVERCARRQQEILDHAASMLKPGGRLVYSTCTFAPAENEGTISRFLSLHPEFRIEKTPKFEGLSGGRPEWGDESREDLKETIRIWPHKTEGEGHYIAVLRKCGGDNPAEDREESLSERARKRKYPSYLKDKKKREDFTAFCRETLAEAEKWTERQELILYGEQLYLLPPQMSAFEGLKVLRPGLHLGSFKKNRFEPSHAWALALKEEEAGIVCRLTAPQTAAYLRGEALSSEQLEVSPKEAQKGWTLMTVDGYSIGWAKLSGGILKNHYPKGLRK